MANPTITFTHGLLEDCNDASSYSEYLSGIDPADADLIVVNNDHFQLSGKCDNVGDEYVYYVYNFSPNISSDTYRNFLLRYRTFVGSNGLGARVKLNFTSGDQFILGATAPQFSTTWKVISGEITAGKTIDEIWFWADDYPNTVDSGTHYVYYDFLLLHEDTFEFPHWVDLDLIMRNRYGDIEIPGRVGDITQYLGMKSPEIRLSGDMKHGWTWGSNKITYGEFLHRIFYDADVEAWQWFTSDLINCKVTPRDFNISQNETSNAKRKWNLIMKQYSLSCGSKVDWNEWLGVQP